MDNKTTFETEVEHIVNMGYTSLQASCFVSDYYDDYICCTYNGGCKHIDICKEIKNKLIATNTK